MSLDTRAVKILHKLIVSNSYIEPEQIQDEFSISKRTFQYDIEKIDEELNAAGFSEINKVRSKGFFLSRNEKEEISEWLRVVVEETKVFTISERKIRTFIYLTVIPTRAITESLMEYNEISRNTVLQDIKQLKEALKEFDLEIGFDSKEGKVIIGDEKNIRHFFVFYCLNDEEIIANGNILKTIKSRMLVRKRPVFPNTTLIKEALFSVEKKLQIKFTDEILERLVIMISFYVERIKQKKFVSNEIYEEIDEDVMEAAETLYQQLIQVDYFVYDNNEICFLAKILLSANQIEASSKIESKFIKCSQQVISDFERLACITFDQKEQLQNDLLLHLKPAYYRIKYQIEVINPSSPEVKTNYSDVFEITDKALQSFKELLNLQIPDREIAYIAILFGGYLTRKKSILVTQKKVLIICSKGIGTSRIIEQQLRQLLPKQIEMLEPMSLREYEQNKVDADFIVSTLPLLTSDIPVFIVSPILNEQQKKALLQEIAPHLIRAETDSNLLVAILDTIDQFAVIKDREQLKEKLKTVLFQAPIDNHSQITPNISELLPEKRIQFKDSETSWQSAIQTASNPLLKEGFISENYQRAMIKNIEKYGPYIVITPGMALPHSEPEDGAFKLGMSLLVLNEPVAFSSKEKDKVKILIVLSSIDKYTHLNALRQLTDLVMNQKFLKKIVKTRTPKEVFRLLTD